MRWKVTAGQRHCFWAGKKNHFLFEKSAQETSAIAAIITAIDSDDFGVVGAGVGVVVPIEGNVRSVMTGTGVTTVVTVTGRASTILNRVDPVASTVIPETLTIYSYGLNVDASTGNDHRFNAPLPCSIFTVPAAPENSALWDL